MRPRAQDAERGKSESAEERVELHVEFLQRLLRVLHLLAENVALALTLLIGLAFKDETNQSVFPISPVEIIWIIMVTSGLPDMGLGMEIAAPEVMDRPPQSVSSSKPFFNNSIY